MNAFTALAVLFVSASAAACDDTLHFHGYSYDRELPIVDTYHSRTYQAAPHRRRRFR